METKHTTKALNVSTYSDPYQGVYPRADRAAYPIKYYIHHSKAPGQAPFLALRFPQEVHYGFSSTQGLQKHLAAGG